MGLLDSITEMIGGANVTEMITKMLAEKGVSPQITEMIKNIDAAKAQELFQYIQKNGFPDDAGDIQKIISMFSEKKPAAKKPAAKPATKPAAKQVTKAPQEKK